MSITDFIGGPFIILGALVFSTQVSLAIISIVERNSGLKQGFDEYERDFSDWPPDR